MTETQVRQANLRAEALSLLEDDRQENMNYGSQERTGRLSPELILSSGFGTFSNDLALLAFWLL